MERTSDTIKRIETFDWKIPCGKVTVLPENATGVMCSWRSLDPSVADVVRQDGKDNVWVRILSGGTARIELTATGYNGNEQVKVSQIFTLVVEQVPTDITVRQENSDPIYVGGGAQFKIASIGPPNSVYDANNVVWFCDGANASMERTTGWLNAGSTAGRVRVRVFVDGVESDPLWVDVVEKVVVPPPPPPPSPINMNLDASSVRAAFQQAKNGVGSLECPDLTKWFVDRYTTLKWAYGNGCAQAENTARDNGLPVPSSTPSAPAIFSVAAGVKAFGSSGSSAGHTGIVLSVDTNKKEVTVIHTGGSLGKNDFKCTISVYSYPKEGVTFTYLGGHLKN